MKLTIAFLLVKGQINNNFSHNQIFMQIQIQKIKFRLYKIILTLIKETFLVNIINLHCLNSDKKMIPIN